MDCCRDCRRGDNCQCGQVAIRPVRQAVQQLGIAVHAGAGQPDRQSMPALIGLVDQRQRRRDPVGRLVFLPTPFPTLAHHAIASGKVTLS
jgi:hypothetical protein